MNVILIVSDTFRRDHLGCYGNTWVKTPNLDKLASESFVFDNAYTASFPTVPNRHDIMTGRFTFTYADWEPLPRDEVVLAQVLSEAGYVTMMVADTPHILQRGFHYDRGFSGFVWVRGQENDRLRTDPQEVELPCNPSKLRHPDFTVVQYLRNTALRTYEEDYFVAMTMREAARWLERNRRAKFFLYVDTFDPHEPWDPPEWYVELYDPGYEGEKVIYPRYAPCDFLTERELKHVRALYAGEVTMVDSWVGYLLKRVEEMGLLDKTTIIFTTDHGFLHGEHGIMGKSLIWPGGYADVPLYEEIARIPLIIRLPGMRMGRRIKAYAQPPDLMPTILDLCGAEIPDTVQGTSLLPVMRGERAETRPLAISTPPLCHDPNGGRPTTITCGEWSLIYYGNPDTPLMRHLTAAVDSIERPAVVPTEKVPEPELYHLPSDPGQKRNVISENRGVAEQLHRMHVEFLERLGMEERFLRHRRRLW